MVRDLNRSATWTRKRHVGTWLRSRDVQVTFVTTFLLFLFNYVGSLIERSAHRRFAQWSTLEGIGVNAALTTLLLERWLPLHEANLHLLLVEFIGQSANLAF